MQSEAHSILFPQTETMELSTDIYCNSASKSKYPTVKSRMKKKKPESSKGANY